MVANLIFLPMLSEPVPGAARLIVEALKRAGEVLRNM
jgi:hypothetical protein